MIQKNLVEHPDYRVLELILDPGEEIKPHFHKNRSESWTIISGEAWVKIEETSLPRSTGEIVAIARWSPHILRNRGKGILKVIEVQQFLLSEQNPDEDWHEVEPE
jgi:mannose-6-phosphate isomerase-like protein (cupin superfamily)